MTLQFKSDHRSDSNGNGIVLKNFTALALLQGTNFLLPLITIPYLLRTLGPDKFGLVALAQAIQAYFILFTDYGFSVSATQQVSASRSDQGQLVRIFSAVSLTRLLLCLISFCLLFISIQFIDRMYAERRLVYLSFGMVIGQSIFPAWFFMGMERMKVLTYLNLAAKVVFTVLIFLLIDQPSDYVYVPLLYAMGNIFSGFIGIGLVVFYFRIPLISISFNEVLLTLKNGWHVFVSSFSTGLFLYINILILTLFASNSIVGYYSVAEKVVIATSQLSTLFSQALYPRVCSLVPDFNRIGDLLRKLYFPFCAFIFSLSVFIFFMAAWIVRTLAGEVIPETVILLKIMAFTPFFFALSIPPYQILFAFNFKESHSRVFFLWSVINVGLSALLAFNFQAFGTAIAVILTQFMITVHLYISVEVRHPEYSLASLLKKKELT